MKSYSLLNITGNKRSIADQIFSILPLDCSGLTYVDPFFGSGGAYFNVSRNFLSYECSDLFPLIINFICQDFSNEILSDYYNKVTQKWDFHNKDAYYNFREFWNENREKGPRIKYIGFMLLAGACINGLYRFGPNGFNQSYGNRIMKKEQLLDYKKHIKSNSSFSIKNFLDIVPSKTSVLYLDPPYSDTGALTQMFGFWELGLAQDLNLIRLIKSQDECNGKFILSTIKNSFLHNELKDTFRNIDIKKTYKVSVGKHLASSHEEIIVTNLGD
ncbi:DNA adenine methylase [Candidatus Daviesbacteria bacterium]|nr:DNA adenine methylase [Candidatus Daviesbacteria bacterium]